MWKQKIYPRLDENKNPRRFICDYCDGVGYIDDYKHADIALRCWKCQGRGVLIDD
jgi:hypothetical protein